MRRRLLTSGLWRDTSHTARQTVEHPYNQPAVGNNDASLKGGTVATLQSRTKDALSDAPGTPGIVRQFAFKEDDVLVIRARVDPGVSSGWHHHGDHDVYGYVVSGSIRFEAGPGGEDTISVSQGDFFHVPARSVHRDVNPSDSEGHEVILFLPGRGPMVVNVDGPDPASSTATPMT